MNLTEQKADMSASSCELKTVLSFQSFYNAFEAFLRQADENVISKKASGTRHPYGISGGKRDSGGKLIIDGGALGQQYGQGTASKTPYFNWHVLSIYYVTAQQKIILGIEADRYHSLELLSPYILVEIPGRNTKVAVFEEYNKKNIDYEKLYCSFIRIAEKIMDLGL